MESIDPDTDGHPLARESFISVFPDHATVNLNLARWYGAVKDYVGPRTRERIEETKPLGPRVRLR
jgi:hypothetical protein